MLYHRQLGILKVHSKKAAELHLVLVESNTLRASIFQVFSQRYGDFLPSFIKPSRDTQTKTAQLGRITAVAASTAWILRCAGETWTSLSPGGQSYCTGSLTPQLMLTAWCLAIMTLLVGQSSVPPSAIETELGGVRDRLRKVVASTLWTCGVMTFSGNLNAPRAHYPADEGVRRYQTKV